MLSTLRGATDYNDDENDDNMSDEDQWLEMTRNISSQYPVISHDGIYYRPASFCLEGVSYGDCGYFRQDFPIWICGGISECVSDLGTDVREELLKVFDELNEQRKDFHKHPSPVEDIIDPDLLLCKPIQPSGRSNPTIDCYHWSDKIANISTYDFSTLRGSYQWIPSVFRLFRNDHSEWQVHIETPISHLPMTDEYGSTYRNLEKVFAKLVPMFNEILSFSQNNDDIRLQVIVKVQSYHIQPGVKYSGRWHTEGHSENIRAVGVYYLYIDKELEGGALKFRPPLAPSPNYAQGSRIAVNRYVMPETNAAIVFNNFLPHRFCSICNSTSVARRRTFLNFFVVNPSFPIKTLSICNLPLVSYDRCLALLKNIGNFHGRHILPDLVIEKILSFLRDTMWRSDIDAKEFRARVRHEMVNEHSGWLGIQYGNEGEVEFIKSTYHWNRRRQINIGDLMSNPLAHTESDEETK